MTGLFLHRSSDATALAAELASRLGVPCADPFALDLVVTPHAHLRRWLTNELAHRLGRPGEGVCAGVTFTTPGGLLRGLGDPVAFWRPQQLTWRLLELIGAHDLPQFKQLRRHLANSRDSYRVGRRIAGIFQRYLHWRPALVEAWERGRDVDEAGDALGFDGWQPQLWRLAAADASPLQSQRDFLTRLRDAPDALALPEQLSIVEPDPLSPWWLDILAALAEHREVHVSLRQVTASRWPAPAADDAAARLSAFEAGRHAGLPSLADGNTLLPQLSQAGGTLGWLQRRLTGLDEPAPSSDDTVQVHAGHGLERQVEILREVITGVLAADPTLEPRHIVVGCANLAEAAPLITAAFRLPAEVPGRHPANDFRVQLADRSSAESNPALGALVQVLGLIESRATAADVIDLCARPPVAARFGFDEDSLDRIGQLAEAAGVRWGLSGRHRARFGLGEVRQNTWLAGLQRMLLGVALSEDRLPTVGTTLPLHDVQDGDLTGLGGMAELLARLGTLAALTETPCTLAGWVERLQQAVDDFTLVTGDEAWQRTDAQLRLAELAERGAGEAVVQLPEVLALLADEFERGRARSTYGNGSLTVCALQSLRGVPYRVVCLLGLDDGVFPHRPDRDGDNLMLRDPRPGEPDPAAQDRQALADAALAARQALVLVHQGRSALTNEIVPAPAALADLLDVLAQGSVAPVQHPLQPFSPELFDAAAPRSYDPAGLRGALALAGPRQAPKENLSVPPAAPVTEVALDDLIALAADPVKRFLRVRCDLSLGEAPVSAEEIPIELGALQNWSVGNRLLRLVTEGHSLDDAVQAEWLRGQVPPGHLGHRLLEEVRGTVQSVVENLPIPLSTPVVHRDLAFDCGPIRLTGRVSTRDDVILDTAYSRLGPKHRVGTWLRLVALTAATGRGWRAASVGRNGTLKLRGPDPDTAHAVLDRWLRLYRIGLDAPLPLPAHFGENLARLLGRGVDPLGARREIGSWYRPSTNKDDAWAMFYETADDLLAVGIGSDTLDQPEESMLACAAARVVWDPLTDHEVR